MAITADQIKTLRAETGAGVLDCRKALEQANGDFSAALEFLREKGLAKAAKRAEREASEGVVELYSHGNGRVGVMVEVNSESDFVARSEVFRKFAHEVALQIAAAAPHYVHPEQIPAEMLENERAKARRQAFEAEKSANEAESLAESRIEKYLEEVCLLRQPYIRDESITVEKLLHKAIVSLGENIVIRRFARWEVGESSTV